MVKRKKQEKGGMLLCDVINDPTAGKRPLSVVIIVVVSLCGVVGECVMLR